MSSRFCLALIGFVGVAVGAGAQVAPPEPPIRLPQNLIWSAEAAYLPDGEVVAVLEDPDAQATFFYRYSEDGELLAGPIDLGLWPPTGPGEAPAALLPVADDVALLVTESFTDDKILLRWLTREGLQLGQPETVNPAPGYWPAAALGADGGCVVTWHDTPLIGSHLWARPFRPDGTPYGAPVDLGAFPAGGSRNSVVALPNAGFAVGWVLAGTGAGLFQRLAADGTLVDPVPRPLALPGGNLAPGLDGFWQTVTHYGPGFETRLVAQKYDQVGNPIGDPSSFLQLDDELRWHHILGEAPTPLDGLVVFYQRSVRCGPHHACQEVSGVVTLDADGGPIGQPVELGVDGETFAANQGLNRFAAVTEDAESSFLHLLK